jgi:hypothetical protein
MFNHITSLFADENKERQTTYEQLTNNRQTLKSNMPLQTHEVHVATDSSEEIDDQLAMLYLRTVDVPMNLTFIFTGTSNITGDQSLKEFTDTFEPHIPIWTPRTRRETVRNVTLTTLETYKHSGPHNPDYFLQIAPMKNYTGHNLEVNQKYILAGDFKSDSPSFNMAGSEALTMKFYEQGKLVDISSHHMATMRFNEELLSKFTGPFNEYIVFTAFKLAFGRMHPKCPVAKKFAEGLVNPDVGRGVNYTSVMTIAENLDAPAWQVSPWRHSPRLDESKKYFDDIFGDDWTDTNGSILKLDYICEILHWINVKATGNGDADLFLENGGEVFYSDFTVDTIPELLKPSWEYFKANASKLIDCFNPVYDLFAAYVMVGYIKGSQGGDPRPGRGRISHSVTDFQKNIVREF